MRFLWRVFVTALFPAAGHLFIAALVAPWRLDGPAIADLAIRWLTAAAIVHSISVRMPIFATGLIAGIVIGLNAGASAYADSGAAEAFAAPLLSYSALGLILGLGAWIARLAFPPHKPATAD